VDSIIKARKSQESLQS
jgi:hypothetical protein